MEDSDEQSFRRDRRWISFKAQVFTALSMATFIGLLGKIVPEVVDLLGNPSSFAAATAAAVANPLPAIAVAATLALGVAITWFAQHEWTEMRVLEDDHLAKRNAQCNAEEKARVHQMQAQPAIEHEQNCRADGTSWQQATANKPELVVSR